METVDSTPRRTQREAMRELRTLLAPAGQRMLSQKELAKQLGYTQEHVQRLETGRARLLAVHVEQMAQLRVPAGREEAVKRVLDELRALVAASTAQAERELVPGAPRTVWDALAVLRGKVEELGNRLGAFGATLADAVKSMEERVGAVLAKVEALGAKADAVAARVEDANKLLDRTDAKIDSTEARVSTAEKNVSGKLESVARVQYGQLVVMALGFAILVTLHCHHAPGAVPAAAPNVTINMGAGQGASEMVAQARCTQDPKACLSVLESNGSGQMGKKEPVENWVTSEPLEGQKRGPCDARYGEEEFGGGCWQRTDIPPPCGPLYRRGDRCYRPIAAKPQQPLGGEPRQVSPERQGQ